MLRALTEGWTPLIILVVIILLFGAPKLPALAKSIGQSMKILKTEVREGGEKSDVKAASSTDSTDSDTKS
ncbi:MAG: twin-arginine translocase TatA/TatE family subunit [Microbacteriaceae bacterium]